MYGALMADPTATGAVIVTMSAFTDDAKGFARGKKLRLVDASELRRFILEDETRSVMTLPAPNMLKAEEAPICPKCKTPMVQRNTKRGANVGRAFWGCANFPGCYQKVLPRAELSVR
jgi:restriction system protein